MDISSENAERLEEIQQEMLELLNEFKGICKTAMSRNEYEMFRYRTLAHIEPGLTFDSPWVTTYSSIDPLEKIVENAKDSAEDSEEEEEEG